MAKEIKELRYIHENGKTKVANKIKITFCDGNAITIRSLAQVYFNPSHVRIIEFIKGKVYTTIIPMTSIMFIEYESEKWEVKKKNEGEGEKGSEKKWY